MGRKVYAMGGETGPIKLGKSNDPDRRLRDMQTMSPMPLELIHQADETESINEKDLHRIFAGSRLHGEWFEIDRETVKIVFSGNDRIGRIMKMTHKKLGRLMRAYGVDDMKSCICRVVESPDCLLYTSPSPRD